MSINFINEDELTQPEEVHPGNSEINFNMKSEVLPQMSVQQKHALSINCLAIANHIQVCPLCSQFYKCDKRGHNVTIIILILIILILLKKILGL